MPERSAPDRFASANQRAEWDARYGEHDEAMWSGRPNGRLVAEVTGLTPATALDVGCGEAGGVLLAVYHDIDHEHREHIKSRGFDPVDYVGAGELRELLIADFTIELDAVEPRLDPPPGTPHVADIVLRARRR